MNGHSGPKVTVLYKISNVKGEHGAYNAFELPGTSGAVNLTTVKENCIALQQLSASGAHGYHWRVRVEDKVSSTSVKASPKYSWWDIQDDNARLPIQLVGFSDLQRLLSNDTSESSMLPSSSSSSSNGMVGKLNKAMNKVAASVENATTSSFDNGPKVPILMFKLLDLGKIHNEYNITQPSSSYVPKRRAAAPSANRQPQQQVRQSMPSNRVGSQSRTTTGRGQTTQPVVKQSQQNHRVPEGSLMDFGSGTSSSHHSNHSAPPSIGITFPPNAPQPQPVVSNETRAEKLKREYKQKQQNENRIWDEVDQRWVTVDTKNGATVKTGTTSAPPTSSNNNAGGSQTAKIVGISLDNVDTTGKSATAKAAIEARVGEMRANQEKALSEIREREEAKKMKDAEEDVARQKLEPKIKAWSEEHGKKKQLRALLASLHTILWPGAKWKPVNLGDLLDDKKCKLAYHKASRVVHPDKTHHLPADQRFLAKRIFDALSQAKTEFDNK